MPKKKTPELKPKEQFKRFVETAKELGVDETGKEFERAFRQLSDKRRKVPKKRRNMAD
jgi:hypothetical protein